MSSRIVTANLNGIRATHRRGGLPWLAAQQADVIAMQETRCTRAQADAAIESSDLAGMHLVLDEGPSAGRAGVGLLLNHEPAAVRRGSDMWNVDGRWLEADVILDGVMTTVVSAYIHTGEADTPKQDDKYALLDHVTERMTQLREAGTPVVVTGDFNIAHTQADLKNWKGNRGKAGFLPEEQAYLTRWLTDGWADVVRDIHGEVDGPYTWWSYRGKAFDNDAGWRIDYHFAHAITATHASIGRAAAYDQRWSDHAAVTVDYEHAQSA